MVSYNDVAKLTYYSEHNKNKELIDLFCSICGSYKIIDILEFIRYERFVEESSSIKLLFKEKDLLIFKENFLLNIPEPSPTTHTIDDITFYLDFPKIVDYNCKPMHCIQSISYGGDHHNMDSTEDFNIIPITLYRKLEPQIQEYIEELQNIQIYSVGEMESRFMLNYELIIKIIYLAFVNSFRNIIDERLFLMKEYNFTYEAFDKLSYFEVKQYLKRGIALTNERNNPKTP